jgi:NAD-dependent dihydropyrimidine dehydrogenase PreA subunit
MNFHYKMQGGTRMAEETYEGIPRDKIPWAPKIDYEKCITCGKCVDYCHVGAFDFEEKEGKKKTVVKNPNSCIVFCRGCEDICPVDAITHPSEEETQKIIEKLQRAKP